MLFSLLVASLGSHYLKPEITKDFKTLGLRLQSIKAQATKTIAQLELLLNLKLAVRAMLYR